MSFISRTALDYGAHRCETAPVDFAYAMAPQRFNVARRRITFMPVKTVLRIAFVQAKHFGVARRFRQYRCGCNDFDGGISPDDRAHWNGEPRAMQAIDQHFVGPVRQGFDGAPHGEQAGLKNIQAVDLLDARRCDGPGKR
jgi:hypothetical protein